MLVGYPLNVWGTFEALFQAVWTDTGLLVTPEYYHGRGSLSANPGSIVTVANVPTVLIFLEIPDALADRAYDGVLGALEVLRRHRARVTCTVVIIGSLGRQRISNGTGMQIIVKLKDVIIDPAKPVDLTTMPAEKATSDTTPQVTPPVERLLRACAKPSLRTELQTALALSDRKHFRTQHLDPALNAGLIERTIPAKPNSRLQKYRLTAKGRATIKK